MKIAVPTDDGKRIAEHFGRAQSFLIFTVEESRIISRDAVNSRSPHTDGTHSESPGECARFMPALDGTDVIISRGMGRRAVGHFQETGIKPVFTDLEDAKDAVRAYANGTLRECSQPECGHH